MPTETQDFLTMTGDDLYALVSDQFAEGRVMQLTTYTHSYRIKSLADIRLRSGNCEFRWGRTWYPFSSSGMPLMSMRFGRCA